MHTESGGVVGSWSSRLQQVRGSNPGGVGSLFGWILAAGKKNLRNSLLGDRVKTTIQKQRYIDNVMDHLVYRCKSVSLSAAKRLFYIGLLYKCVNFINMNFILLGFNLI